MTTAKFFFSTRKPESDSVSSVATEVPTTAASGSKQEAAVVVPTNPTTGQRKSPPSPDLLHCLVFKSYSFFSIIYMMNGKRMLLSCQLSCQIF